MFVMNTLKGATRVTDRSWQTFSSAIERSRTEKTFDSIFQQGSHIPVQIMLQWSFALYNSTEVRCRNAFASLIRHNLFHFENWDNLKIYKVSPETFHFSILRMLTCIMNSYFRAKTLRMTALRDFCIYSYLSEIFVAACQFES